MIKKVFTYLFIMLISWGFYTATIYSADSKISDLPSIDTPADGDMLIMVDISDTTYSTTGRTKQITWDSTIAALETHYDTIYQAPLTFTLPLLDTNETVSIYQVNDTTDGYLDSTHWNTFNSKQVTLTHTAPLVDTNDTVTITIEKDLVTTAPLNGGTNDILPGSDSDITISISQATDTTGGYLDSTDWGIFNGKQDALTFTSPLIDINDTATISQSNDSTDGYLDSTNFSNFESSFAHIIDSTQAHSDYLRNNVDDTTSGRLFAAGFDAGDTTILNVGEIELDLIRSDTANGPITIELDSAAAADFIVGNNNTLVVEGDNERVGIKTSDPRGDLDVQPGTIYVGRVGAINGVINSGDSLFFNIDYDASSSATNFIIGKDRTDITGGTELFRVQENGNTGIGTATFGTNAASVFAIGNGTAPSSSPANMIQLYAEDVSSSSELKVRDEAGNITTLSPHPTDELNKLPVDEAHEFPHVYKSSNNYLGKEIVIDMTLLAYKIQQLYPNEKILTIKNIPKKSWRENQNLIEQYRDKKIISLQVRIKELDKKINKETDNDKKKSLINEKGNIKIPDVYKKKDIPKWIKDRL